MKKVLVVILVVALVLSCFAGCGGGGNAVDVVVMVPNADHGWTGAVLTYAKEKVAEIYGAGKYNIIVQTSTDAANQISQVEDVIANKSAKAIVILPQDNSLEATMAKVVAAKIPFIMFDRIIDSVKADAISSVMGDNAGIGYETAKRFVEKGLQPGDKIYTFVGDLSSVPGMRNDGFKKGLKDNGWSDAQISENVTFSAATGWSRSTGKQMFVDWINSLSVDQIKETRFIFTHDDEIGMGILEALKSTEIEASKKEAFLSGNVSLSSSSGLNEMYSVLKGTHQKDYATEISKLKDLFSVTYDPAMINEAIAQMINHLEGKTVEKEIVISVKVVDSTNVGNFKGFGDAVSK